MSLQVWLPLNGNLENYGLGHVKIISGTPSYKYGKIGVNSLNLNSRIYFSCEKLSNIQTFSICFWAMTEESTTLTTNWQDLIGFTDVSSSGTNGTFRWETCYGSTITNYIGIHWHDNTTNAFVNGSAIHSKERGKWCHCCVVFDLKNKKLFSYTNGDLIATHTHLEGYFNNEGKFYLGETNNIEGRIQDVRIYDHALSVKEIKEISKGLCLHYQFKDEIGIFSNKIYDTSGYLNNGIISNNIINDLNTPRYQLCYNFTPTAYIGIQNQPLNSSLTDFSFCFWMKTTTPTSTMCLWNGRNNIGTALGIFAVGGIFRYDDGAQNRMTNYSIPNNEWHHYVFTRNSSNIKFYVDGELIQIASSTNFSDIGQNATIGASSINSSVGSGNTFTGCLSDYRIYATTLSDEDVFELYKVAFQIDNNGNSYSYEFIEQE